MKQTSILIISFVLCCSSLSTAQTYTQVTNVKTANNSTVPDTYSLTSTDISYTSSQLSALASEISTNYNGAILIEAPSYKYNCHAYAWHVSEGGSKVWIGLNTTTAEDVYWNDGSFIEVSESGATKVSYHQNGNHSAIRLDNNWYQSKWGQNALVKHHPNDVPTIYKPSMTKKYYKKAPPFISGPLVICSGSSSTFTVSRAPASYTWNKSSNLTLSSTSGNTATFTANGTGPAWVSILENGTELTRKTVYAGVLQTADFSGSCGGPETGSTGLFTGSALSSYSVSEFEWGVAPGWTVVSHPNFPSSIPMGNVRITRTDPYAPTTTPVWIRARNSCGWSNEKALGTLSSSSVYTVSAYPNPVSDVLNVLIEEEVLALSETTGSSASGIGRVKPVYTIRLYNLTTGAPTLQTSANEAGTVQMINVGNLPNGIYVLHVHDGTENPPHTHRIVVSH